MTATQGQYRRISALPPSLPPRGINKEAAAEFVGVGVSLFEEMVRDGRMPSPQPINSRIVWDVRKLDAAFDALSNKDLNEWDTV